MRVFCSGSLRIDAHETLFLGVPGVFGVPLEMLVEREGADCVLGASHATLRVPSIIDDVVSAMRQMGASKEQELDDDD